MNRGDVFELRLTRGSQGREQKGRRYGVIVQSDVLAPLSTTIVAPTSTAARGAAFRPEVDVGGRRVKVLCEQLRAVDPGRLGKRVARLEPDELEALDAALLTVLGIRG